VHQCPTCGKQLEESIRFCPDDGTPLTETAAAASARTPTGQPTKKMELQLPVVVGGRYRLEETRGGGGMASVYRAVDLTLEREVAVKLINPELRVEPEFDARFQREARIASQLADPHIVVVHDFGIDVAHGPYLVMEFLKGQSLRERLQTQGPLPLKAALQLSAQLLLALIHAHEKGIVHRDIKPDNIFLLNVSGIRLHVRVLDFGIARIYRRDDRGRPDTLTNPGAVLGTPRYMSPEQLAGQPVDVRSDLFSAGLVIHESLTGQMPYVSGKKLCELCPDAQPALQDLLDHCLKQNMNERPTSAIEVYLRLQELGKASGILLLPPGAMDKLVAARQAQEPTVEYTPKPRGLLSRRGLLIGLVLAGLLALGLAIWGIVALVKLLSPTPMPDQESLLDIKIGDSRDDVVAKLGKPQPGVQARLPGLVNGLLIREEKEPRTQQVLSWSDHQVCVLLTQDKVQAVVVRSPHKGSSGRKVKIGDSEARLVHAYSSEIPKIEALDPKDEKRGKIYHYDPLGISFEVVDEKVIATFLFPPNLGNEREKPK